MPSWARKLKFHPAATEGSRDRSSRKPEGALFHSTAIARAMSKRFQGVSFLGGSHKKRIRSLVTGCVKLKEYAQRASLPFCARSPP